MYSTLILLMPCSCLNASKLWGHLFLSTFTNWLTSNCPLNFIYPIARQSVTLPSLVYGTVFKCFIFVFSFFYHGPDLHTVLWISCIRTCVTYIQPFQQLVNNWFVQRFDELYISCCRLRSPKLRWQARLNCLFCTLIYSSNIKALIVLASSWLKSSILLSNSGMSDSCIHAWLTDALTPDWVITPLIKVDPYLHLLHSRAGDIMKSTICMRPYKVHFHF